MERAPVESREVDVGKSVLNHYKYEFYFFYPYLFTLSLLH